jgi:hypothetical protein
MMKKASGPEAAGRGRKDLIKEPQPGAEKTLQWIIPLA